MFDNLIARAIVPITVAVTGFVVLGCIMLYTVIKEDMTAEAVQHVDSLAETVVKSTRYAMLKTDRESLRNIVENVGTLTEVGQIRIYDQNGRVRFSANPNETARASEAVTLDAWANRLMRPGFAERTEVHHNLNGPDGLLAISVPILNEKNCSTGSCHFHAGDEPVLGFLSLGISRESLEKTLALLKSRMLIFSLMVLFLTIGGVAALLRVNLFLPLQRLTFWAREAVQGTSADQLPRPGKRAWPLERDLYSLVQQRDQALQDQKTASLLLRDVDEGAARDSRFGFREDHAEAHTALSAGPGQNSQA